MCFVRINSYPPHHRTKYHDRYCRKGASGQRDGLMRRTPYPTRCWQTDTVDRRERFCEGANTNENNRRC